MKIQFKWEECCHSISNLRTSRAKVLGGWLVREEMTTGDGVLNHGSGVALVFVSDPKHEWKIQ